MVSNEEEAQLSFLLSGTSDVVPSSYTKLRSYLNIHLSNLADQRNLNLPKSFRNRNKTCPHCYTEWSCDTSSFKLLPSKKNKKTQKGVNDEEQIKESRNTLVLKCKVCTNKSLFSLVKKIPVKKVVNEQTVPTGKKKKKKKDKTCGLMIKLKKGERLKVSKKKKRSENTKQSVNPNPASNHPQSSSSETSKKIKNKSNDKNKKLFCNPYAFQSQGKLPRKNNNKLKSLKEALKNDKGSNSAQKTLKDFLTLI